MAQTDAQYRKRDNSKRVCVRAVCIKNGQLLVIKRFKDGESFTVLPGGGIDPGEDLKTAAVRECLEETTVEVCIKTQVHKESPRPGFPETFYYSCDYVSGQPSLDPQSEEFKRSVGGKNTYEPAWIS